LRIQKEQNSNIFFRWDKDLIINKHWASLPLASRTIFPVIAVHQNKEGGSWPSQQTIADLSGYSEKTVREGLKGLLEKGFSGIKIKKYRKEWMQWAGTYYKINPLPVGKKGYFPFHKALVISKNWSKLKSTAKALYPVMRCFGYNDGFGRNYKPHDYCDRKKTYLAEFAGIDRRSIAGALKSLQSVDLIEPVSGRAAWRVFIISK
jgi:hypothetical protein